MLEPGRVTAYLNRIGFPGRVTHDAETLEALQRAHLTAVPFENLHVFFRRGVTTGVDRSVPKIIDEGRGGWCYELNGAFAALLEALDFDVTRIGANVLLDGIVDPGPDHLSIRVDLDRPYLVDVGFGDSFIRPLPLDDPGPHDGGTGTFGFTFEEVTTLLEVAPNPRPLYRFDHRPHTTSDFDEASRRLQANPERGWTRRPFATRLIDGGPDRVTLLHDCLKIRTAGEWSEEPVTPEQWPQALFDWFGIREPSLG
jgi:N-hydroxyarylamine O-acetyltransferase